MVIGVSFCFSYIMTTRHIKLKLHMNDVWMVLHKFGTDGKIQDGHPSSSNFSIGFSYNILKLFISETSERLKLKQNEYFWHHLIPRLCFWCQSEIQDDALDSVGKCKYYANETHGYRNLSFILFFFQEY